MVGFTKRWAFLVSSSEDTFLLLLSLSLVSCILSLVFSLLSMSMSLVLVLLAPLLAGLEVSLVAVLVAVLLAAFCSPPFCPFIALRLALSIDFLMVGSNTFTQGSAPVYSRSSRAYSNMASASSALDSRLGMLSIDSSQPAHIFTDSLFIVKSKSPIFRQVIRLPGYLKGDCNLLSGVSDTPHKIKLCSKYKLYFNTMQIFL